jgi:hypothetical protein
MTRLTSAAVRCPGQSARGGGGRRERGGASWVRGMPERAGRVTGAAGYAVANPVKGGNPILAALSPEEMEQINELLHVVHLCPWQILHHAATAYTPPLEEIS